MSTDHLHEEGPSTALLTLHAGRTNGLRTVSTLESMLQVGAAPWAERRRLMSCTAYLFPYHTYVLDKGRPYIGHGDEHREFAAHRKEKDHERPRQIYLIGSQDSRFNKELATLLEAKLVETAVRAGLELSNANLPHGISGGAPSASDKWVRQAIFLLDVAGFKRFSEAQGKCAAPQLLPVNTNIDAVRVMPPGDVTVPADAAPLVLSCRDLRVEAYRVGTRLWVMSGSDYGPVCKSGVSSDNRERRRQIEAAGILEPCPDLPGRMRLRHGLDFKYAAVAATVVSGEHLRIKAWQPKMTETAGRPKPNKAKPAKNKSSSRPGRRAGQ